MYLHGFPGRMSNPGCSFTLEALEHQEMNGQLKVAWRMLRTLATYESFGSLYQFCINLYGISYFPGSTNQRPDK